MRDGVSVSPTKRQAILDFLRGAEYPPTIREIQAGVGYKTTSAVVYQLDALEANGDIARTAGRARSIRLADSVTMTFSGEDARMVRQVGRDGIVWMCREYIKTL